MFNKRVFIGVRLTPQAENELQQFLRKLRTAAEKKSLAIKWTPAENWHLTLKFFGSVPEDRIAGIAAAMAEVAGTLPPLRLKLAKVGAFPQERQARVIWIGTNRSAQILATARRLDEAFATLGFPLEAREFSPHITIGRQKNAKSVRELIAPFLRKSFGPCLVTELVLFESQMQGYHPVYSTLASAPLTGAEPTLFENEETVPPAEDFLPSEPQDG